MHPATVPLGLSYHAGGCCGSQACVFYCLYNFAGRHSESCFSGFLRSLHFVYFLILVMPASKTECFTWRKQLYTNCYNVLGIFSCILLLYRSCVVSLYIVAYNSLFPTPPICNLKNHLKETHIIIGLNVCHLVFNLLSSSLSFFLFVIYQWKTRSQGISLVKFPILWTLLIEALLFLICLFIPYFGKLVASKQKLRFLGQKYLTGSFHICIIANCLY